MNDDSRTVTAHRSASPRPAPLRHNAEWLECANAAMLRYARGEDDAFDELYRLLAPRLYHCCLGLAGANDAEELCQEVFLKMHRNREKFVQSGSVLAWAYAIARTTYLDRLRWRRRRSEISIDPAHVERRSAPLATSHPAARLALAQLTTQLQRELSNLSDPQRAAYGLVKIDGLSCADASVRLGVPIDAIKQRVHRANEVLKLGLACFRQAG